MLVQLARLKLWEVILVQYLVVTCTFLFSTSFMNVACFLSSWDKYMYQLIGCFTSPKLINGTMAIPWLLHKLKSSTACVYLVCKWLVIRSSLRKQRRQSILKCGGSSFTQPNAYPYSNFLKCLLRCSLTQAIFTVSSVSVIDLWHCIS